MLPVHGIVCMLKFYVDFPEQFRKNLTKFQKVIQRLVHLKLMVHSAT